MRRERKIQRKGEPHLNLTTLAYTLFQSIFKSSLLVELQCQLVTTIILLGSCPCLPFRSLSSSPFQALQCESESPATVTGPCQDWMCSWSPSDVTFVLFKQEACGLENCRDLNSVQMTPGLRLFQCQTHGNICSFALK